MSSQLAPNAKRPGIDWILTTLVLSVVNTGFVLFYECTHGWPWMPAVVLTGIVDAMAFAAWRIFPPPP